MIQRLALTAILCAALGYALGSWAGSGGPAQPADIRQKALSALKQPAQNERVAAFLDVLEDLGPSSINAVAAALASDSFVASECEVKPFVRLAIDANFENAMPTIQQWTNENLNKWGLEEVARGMVLAGNFDDARSFARSRRSASRRDAFVGGLVEAWADAGDLDDIAQYIRELPDGGRPNTLTDPLVRGLIRRLGLRGAMDWVIALPPDPTQAGLARASFLLTLRFAMIMDPKKGLRWYEKHRELPRAQSGRGVVAAEWIEHDPAAATSWLLEQPPDFESRTALFSSIERWLELDPQAAETWLDAHRDSPIAMAGARALVRYLAYERPLDAIAWTDAIEDERQREKFLAQAIHIWRQFDAGAANEWLAQADDLPTLTRRILGVQAKP